MEVDFHCLEKGRDAGVAPALRLRAVYHLHADQSYRVSHQSLGGRHVLLLSLTGGGRMELSGELLTLLGGSCLLLTPMEEFRYRCEQEEWEFWWFEFEGRQFQPRIERGRAIDLPCRPLWTELCGECLRLLRQGEPDAASAVFGALYSLVESSVSERLGQPAGSGICHSAARYIHAHLSTVTVRELCGRFRVSERTLRNLFHRHLGVAPQEYIQLRRLDAACYLLESTVLSIAEIADSLGYANPFHFSRSFKERQGVPPLAYRRGLEK